jgi:hypothetical protein
MRDNDAAFAGGQKANSQLSPWAMKPAPEVSPPLSRAHFGLPKKPAKSA